MIIEKNNQYAVVCQTKLSPSCSQTSEYHETEEEAQEWVESECWINSGEGWICTKCNEQILQNISKIKKGEGL